MKCLSLAVLVVLSGMAWGQEREEPAAFSGLVDRIVREPGKAPPLSQIFADLSKIIERIDLDQVHVLGSRLDAVNKELELLENLLSLSSSGTMLDLPESVTAGLDFEASEELLLEEERRVADLENTYREQQARFELLRRNRPKALAITEAQRGSRAAEAALSIDLVLPEPPKSEAAKEVATTNEALDSEGMARALYRQGDYGMALREWEKLPTEKLTVDILYYMARCRDLLGRWDEAETGYEAVLNQAPESYWAENAKWMLDFGRQKQRIRKLIDKPTPGGANPR